MSTAQVAAHKEHNGRNTTAGTQRQELKAMDGKPMTKPAQTCAAAVGKGGLGAAQRLPSLAGSRK
ncbi:hypothetical protein IWX79_000149 [Janthinobacterium sp. CAN_S1]